MLTCEVHRHTLNNPDQHCCDILFDSEPIFTNKGTCYRTNKTVYEYYPYSFSAIKIWTSLLQDQTPGKRRIAKPILKLISKMFFPILSELDIIFHGSDAMDGGGITYTIGMVIRVVQFSSGVYKIKKSFA